MSIESIEKTKKTLDEIYLKLEKLLESSHELLVDPKRFRESVATALELIDIAAESIEE